MRLLLDTCTFLWLLEDSPRLSGPARAAVADESNDVYLSAASLWEILVKHSIGRLTLNVPAAADRYFTGLRETLGIEPLSIDEASVTQLPKLPALHRDPFDRILICQAIAHGLMLVTPDEAVRRYPVSTYW